MLSQDMIIVFILQIASGAKNMKTFILSATFLIAAIFSTASFSSQITISKKECDYGTVWDEETMKCVEDETRGSYSG